MITFYANRKLSRCKFYGTFAFKRAIADMRYVVNINKMTYLLKS